MKYQLQPQRPSFNNEGITTHAGWVLIYNVDPNTGEYQYACYEYLPTGVSLPAYSFLDEPQNVDDKHAIVRNADGWTYPNDYRGHLIYSMETATESIVNTIGDIPDNYTLLPPNTQFDSWDGEKWILDIEKKHQYLVDIANTEKTRLMNDATNQLSFLQDAIDAEIATEDEQAAYILWKKYRVALNRIDVNDAPNIDWPVKPQ